jgi:hypothetical protein
MRASVEKFRHQVKRQEPRDGRPSWRFVHLRELGEAQLRYGILLSRSGKPMEAREAFDGCIETSLQMLDAPEANLRTNGQRFMEEARKRKTAIE